MQIYRFRNCLLNTSERTVIKDSDCLELTTKTFDVLQYLIENAGKVLTKDEILGKVWEGNFVEESNLPVHISKLRKLLGDSRESRFIETVQGTGYRFVAPARVVGEKVWNHHRAINKERGLVRTRNPAVESVAIFPLENESTDPYFRYIADGLTESIINDLARVPGLRVIARNTTFRYKGKTFDPCEVGDSLNVSWVVTGRIRKVGDQVIVAAELISVTDRSQLWGKHFNKGFDQIAELQQEISAVLASGLQRGKEAVSRSSQIYYRGTRNSESYKAYLKGRYLFDKRTVDGVTKAIESFGKAIKCDARNIYPVIATVDCYRFLYVIDSISHAEALEKIRPHLEKLGDFGQSLDLLQLIIGELKLQLDWDFAAAENYVKRALVLNPNCIPAHHRLIEILMIRNRFEEATAQIGKVLQIDPLSLLTYKRVGRWFYCLGSYEIAADYLIDALELEPGDYEALALLGAVRAEQGDHSEALRLFRDSQRTHPSVEVLSMIGYVEALAGRRVQAQKIIKELDKGLGGKDRYPLKKARIHLALDEKKETYQMLNLAFDRHEIDLNALPYDPRLKAIRDEVRFKGLMERLGLQYRVT